MRRLGLERVGLADIFGFFSIHASRKTFTAFLFLQQPGEAGTGYTRWKFLRWVQHTMHEEHKSSFSNGFRSANTANDTRDST
jgi:hypothetical protein